MRGHSSCKDTECPLILGVMSDEHPDHGVHVPVLGILLVMFCVVPDGPFLTELVYVKSIYTIQKKFRN